MMTNEQLVERARIKYVLRELDDLSRDDPRLKRAAYATRIELLARYVVATGEVATGEVA